VFDLFDADFAEIEARVLATSTEDRDYGEVRRVVSDVEETVDDRLDAKETITRRKLAYALYREDAYTYGTKPVSERDLPKLDHHTYMMKAGRIIGFSR